MIRIPALIVGGLLVAATGCAAGSRAGGSAPAATAQLRDAEGKAVGSATFSETPGGVRVVVDVSGLPPGDRGVHVHETGTCEPPFESAGKHANPTGRKHGLESPEGPHAGDLPNLGVGQDGSGRLEATAQALTFGAGASSLLDADGSALVVHAGPDDMRTDPAGGSGARVACGVITGS